MMVEFKWIQISLFLVTLLQFTAAAEQHPPSFTVRVGDEVTLPCENIIDGQQNCDSTSWIFNVFSSTAAVRLVRLGQIVEGDKSKSDRLSVTENCSLVIKKVTVEDVGRYTCRQFDKSGRQQGSDSVVHLSVVTMAEQNYADVVTLSCSVWTNEQCRHTVKWLYQNQDVDKENQDVRTSQSGCSSTVTFRTDHHIYTSDVKALKCEVTDDNKVNFTFSLQSSGDKPGEEKTTAPTGTTENSQTAAIMTVFATNDTTKEPKAPTGCSAVNYIMLVLRVAELLLITVITVLLIRAPGNQRPPDDNTLSNSVRRPPVRRSGAAASQVNNDEDEDDGVVKYGNFGDSSA